MDLLSLFQLKVHLLLDEFLHRPFLAIDSLPARLRVDIWSESVNLLLSGLIMHLLLEYRLLLLFLPPVHVFHQSGGDLLRGRMNDISVLAHIKSEVMLTPVYLWIVHLRSV